MYYAKNNKMQALYEQNGYRDRNTSLNSNTALCTIQTLLVASEILTIQK